MSDFQNSVTPLPTANQPTVEDAAQDTTAALEFAQALAQAADERKGAELRILKVADVSYIADYFVIVTGFSSAQVRAIGRSMMDTAAETFDRRPVQTEGQADGTWVLQDYGDVIVHIFMPDAREYYGLEAFWGHAEEVPFESQQ